jgi:hypothetical protein
MWVVALVAALTVAPAARGAETIYALVGPSLSSYSAETGVTIAGNVPVTGLLANETTASIDLRPSTGVLYLLTYNTTANPDQLHLYTVNRATGAATAVGAAVVSPAAQNTTRFAMDVAPNAAFARVLPSDAKNFRLDLGTGAIVGPDANLSFASGDPNSGTPVPVALGYDHNVADATSTTAFALHSGNPNVVLVRLGGVGGAPSPNAGVLTTIGATSIPGAASLTTTMGLDISGATGAAYTVTQAIVGINSVNTTYRVDLTSGHTTALPTSPFAVDIALAPTGLLELAAATVNLSENGGEATVTVKRSASTTGAVSVDYTTSDGSAAAGSDYTAASGTLSFADGETSKTFTVPVADDSADEGRESVAIELSNATGNALAGAILGRRLGTLTIEDNDAPPPVTPPAVTPADTTPPATTLNGVPASLTRARFLKGFTVTLTPNEAAAFAVTLEGKTKKASLASLKVNLFSKSLPLAAGPRPVTVKPNRKGVGKVSKTVKVTLRVVATDAAGNRATTTKTIKVTPDPKKKPKKH